MLYKESSGHGRKASLTPDVQLHSCVLLLGRGNEALESTGTPRYLMSSSLAFMSVSQKVPYLQNKKTQPACLLFCLLKKEMWEVDHWGPLPVERCGKETFARCYPHGCSALLNSLKFRCPWWLKHQFTGLTHTARLENN